MGGDDFRVCYFPIFVHTLDLAGGGGVWVRDCLSRLGVSFRLMPGRSVNCLWCSSPRCLGEGCFFGFSQGGLVGLFVKACDEISSHLRVLVGGPRQRGPSSPSFVSSVSQLCFFGGISPTCTSQVDVFSVVFFSVAVPDCPR